MTLPRLSGQDDDSDPIPDRSSRRTAIIVARDRGRHLRRRTAARDRNDQTLTARDAVARSGTTFGPIRTRNERAGAMAPALTCMFDGWFGATTGER